MNRQTKRLLQKQGQLDEEGQPTTGRRPAPPRRPQATGGGGPEREPWTRRFVEYLREVRVEMAKVAWPNRQEVVKYTLVVLVTLVIMTALVFGLDTAFARGVLFLFGY